MPHLKRSRARKQAADEFGVSERYVQDAKRLS
jgi:hypothetical protein